ncbi:MAG: flagellar L-ring protein [Bryobacterales bacterium]|nr:flagellar L-ring protein [Bryobacterales bacterium]
MRVTILVLLLALSVLGEKKDAKDKKAVQKAPLDVYVDEATRRASEATVREVSPGSLWSPVAGLGDLARDHRASQVDDLVTITVAERASAVATGATKTSRTSSSKTSITSSAIPAATAGKLSNILGLSGQTTLDGQGTTSRDTTLNTNLSARVVQVLPNGYLVVEGEKQIQVDSERQVITVRGVVRPADITTLNTVTSARLAQLEVRINGKGVVADSTRRPFILYRLLMGILPF